jgi:hypothetical protein
MPILVLMSHMTVVLFTHCVTTTLVHSHPGMHNIKLELQCRLLSRPERQETTSDRN